MGEERNESNEKAKRTCGGCKKDEEEFFLPIPKNKKIIKVLIPCSVYQPNSTRVQQYIKAQVCFRNVIEDTANLEQKKVGTGKKRRKGVGGTDRCCQPFSTPNHPKRLRLPPPSNPSPTQPKAPANPIFQTQKEPGEKMEEGHSLLLSSSSSFSSLGFFSEIGQIETAKK